MQYVQTRERSAEILRQALAHMGRHKASLNPLTYAVWYEYVAGINPRLTEALDAQLRVEPELGDDTIRRLYRDHVAAPEEQTMSRIGEDMQRLMSAMADSARQTGQQADVFGEQLSGLSQALNGQDGEALAREIGQALTETAAMRASTQALRDQVSTSENEIQRLRKDLVRAREEALTDGLTRTMNRKGLDDRLATLVTQAPSEGRAHGLVMVDIDHFKKVNDTYGHLTGDRVLQSVGDVLRGVAAAPPRLAARFGGEEFVLLIPETTLEVCLQVAERVRQLTKGLKFKHKDAPDGVFGVTVSAGVASLQGEESLGDWFARADAALYRAKSSGRDQVVAA